MTTDDVKVYTLDKWSLVYVCDTNPSYTAPEAIKCCLYGYRNDKKTVLTSRIVSANGRQVSTHSGSLYILKDVDPEYLEWIDEHGYNFDHKNPIVFEEK